MPDEPGDSGSADAAAQPTARQRWAPVVVVVGVLALAIAVAVVQAGAGDSRHEVISFPPARSGPPAGAEIEIQSRPVDSTTVESVNPPGPASVYDVLRQSPGVVYATDFTSLGNDWSIYDSEGHAGRGLRRPSAVTVVADPEAEGASVLRITAAMGSGEEAGELVSGGLALDRPRVNGTYTFRMRVASDPDEGTSGVAILWPSSNRWPEEGEIDMVETWANRVTRTPVETNIHSLALDADEPYDESDDRLLTVIHEEVDGREWHTYRFEWRPDELAMTIDRGTRRILTVDPTRIPTADMVLTFQLDAFPTPYAPGEDPVLTGEVTLEVDWLVIEE